MNINEVMDLNVYKKGSHVISNADETVYKIMGYKYSNTGKYVLSLPYNKEEYVNISSETKSDTNIYVLMKDIKDNKPVCVDIIELTRRVAIDDRLCEKYEKVKVEKPKKVEPKKKKVTVPKKRPIEKLLAKYTDIEIADMMLRAEREKERESNVIPMDKATKGSRIIRKKVKSKKIKGDDRFK